MNISRRKILKLLGLTPVVGVAGKLAIEDPVRAASLTSKPNDRIGGNNFDKDFTKKLMKSFLEKFEAERRNG